MNCDDARDRLDDYVAGHLSAGERSAIVSHIAGCDSCAADVAAAEALVAPLTTMPRSINPPRDLWPQVARRIAPPPRGRRPAFLVAAAIALMAVSSAVTAVLLDDRTPAPVAASAPIPPAALETEYLRRASVLARLVEQERAMLAPATVATLERNLAVIDRAIEESRAALAADPGSRELETLLRATHEQKVELLEQVTRLSARS